MEGGGKKAGHKCKGIVGTLGREWKEVEKKAGQEYWGIMGRAWKEKEKWEGHVREGKVNSA
jgi:hypothetical protein